MHKENFNTSSVNNFPLTIDRLAELQEDLQAPIKILAGMTPLGNCIVAGCELPGSPGYAVMGVPGESGALQYEVFEVRRGSLLGRYLVLTEQNITAENSDGIVVTVRTERHLTWEASMPGDGAAYMVYSDTPMVMLRKAAHDDVWWVACQGGLWWHAPLNGSPLKVQRSGGRVHLQGSVKYGVRLSAAGIIVYDGNVTEVAGANNMQVTAESNVPVLPSGYRPAGDILIPIRYNGAVSAAIIDGDGRLLMSQTPGLGDTLVINTWLDL